MRICSTHALCRCIVYMHADLWVSMHYMLLFQGFDTQKPYLCRVCFVEFRPSLVVFLRIPEVTLPERPRAIAGLTERRRAGGHKRPTSLCSGFLASHNYSFKITQIRYHLMQPIDPMSRDTLKASGRMP